MPPLYIALSKRLIVPTDPGSHEDELLPTMWTTIDIEVGMYAVAGALLLNLLEHFTSRGATGMDRMTQISGGTTGTMSIYHSLFLVVMSEYDEGPVDLLMIRGDIP